MPETSNPRKLTNSGGMTVVSFPKEVLEDLNWSKGDRVIMESDGDELTVKKVTWSTET